MSQDCDTPTEIFLPLCENPRLVSFLFDVKEGTDTSSFDDLTSLIITIGGALSIIIGIIGIANFVNSVLTSVITHKKEFSILWQYRRCCTAKSPGPALLSGCGSEGEKQTSLELELFNKKERM